MDAVIAFLRENVNGKTLFTKEMEYQLDDGALLGVYADQISFSNLRVTAGNTAFSLDMFIVANEKVYERKNGVRGALRKDESAVSLFRYELAKRRSTGQATGSFRFISASGADVMAEAVVSGISGVQFEDGALCWREEQALYRDQHAEDGYRPVAFAANQRFFIEGGKLHFEYNAESYAVEPATQKCTRAKDDIPPFISVER